MAKSSGGKARAEAAIAALTSEDFRSLPLEVFVPEICVSRIDSLCGIEKCRRNQVVSLLLLFTLMDEEWFDEFFLHCLNEEV
jgi:hypothetical protein